MTRFETFCQDWTKEKKFHFAVAATYCTDSKNRVLRLYRISARTFLVFKNNTANQLIDVVIQYNYNSLPTISVNVNRKKWEADLKHPPEEFDHDI